MSKSLDYYFGQGNSSDVASTSLYPFSSEILHAIKDIGIDVCPGVNGGIFFPYVLGPDCRRFTCNPSS